LVSHFEGEHRLGVFENRVLMRTFGPEMEEDKSWRKLHSDELYGLYSSGDSVKEDEVDGTCGTHGGRERCLQGFS
jgi:hypothetical protein